MATVAEPESVLIAATTGDEVVVTAGVLDDAASLAFMCGECQAMAAALACHIASRTGTSAQAVKLSSAETGDFIHALAVAPDGMWWDVQGEHDPQGCLEAMEDVYGPISTQRMSESERLYSLREPGFEELGRIAFSIAPLVLDGLS